MFESGSQLGRFSIDTVDSVSSLQNRHQGGISCRSLQYSALKLHKLCNDYTCQMKNKMIAQDRSYVYHIIIILMRWTQPWKSYLHWRWFMKQSHVCLDKNFAFVFTFPSIVFVNACGLASVTCYECWEMGVTHLTLWILKTLYAVIF